MSRASGSVMPVLGIAEWGLKLSGEVIQCTRLSGVFRKLPAMKTLCRR